MRFRFFNTHRLLLKASYFNGIIVALKALSGVATTMVVSRVIGPSGLALLGNLRNFTQTTSSFTAEGYQNGAIRYVSEYQEDAKQQQQIIASIFQLSMGVALVFGVVLFLFSSFWSEVVFKTDAYADIIRLVAVGLPFLSLNLLLIYIFNGLERYKKLVVLNGVLSLGNMLMTIVLALQMGLRGALIGVILGPILVFILMLLGLGKEREVLLNLFRFKLFSLTAVKKLSGYLLMTIYATAIVSVTYLMIRNLVIKTLSTEEAGYWEAMNRLSSFYLMFFISLTSFYLLPKLAKTDAFGSFKKELKHFYTLTIPLLVVAFFIIYFLRTWLLQLLLGDEFLPTERLFFWQLVGDFISILAIALVKQFHAKRMIKAYLISNSVLNLSYLIFSHLFIEVYGLQGIVKAYALAYFIYLVLVLFFVYMHFNSKKNE